MPRLPRFKRVPNLPSLELTSDDRQIIRVIHDHRFLRSSHFPVLLNRAPQQLLRRLQLLYHHSYLERPRAQLDYYHSGGGSRPIVYGLGTKGAALLKAELGSEFNPVRWGEKNRSVGRIFLEHALSVSDFMVSLELACRENGAVGLVGGKELRVAGHNPKRAWFAWHVKLAGGVKLGVIPDGVFALDAVGENGNVVRQFFFFESDRGTMPVVRRNLSQTSMYRKFLAYEATWSQSIHQSRFGFNRFRVVTVTKSVKRMKSLVEACGELKRGHGLFLFTHRGAWEEPSDLFSHLFLNGRGETEGLLS